jgi:hypothetical protein
MRRARRTPAPPVVRSRSGRGSTASTGWATRRTTGGTTGGPDLRPPVAQPRLRAEVVPRTIGTHLHGVQPNLAELEQRSEVAAGPDLAVLTLGELVREDVRHEHERPGFAHRARGLRLFAGRACGPDQVGMGVADVEPRYASRVVGTEHRAPRERVVDVAGGCRLAHGAAIVHDPSGVGKSARRFLTPTIPVVFPDISIRYIENALSG